MRQPYTCTHCGAVSHNPNDARERYCARCHRFADDPPKPDSRPLTGPGAKPLSRMTWDELHQVYPRE